MSSIQGNFIFGHSFFTLSMFRVSTWLLFNANEANFQWDDDEVCFVLDQHTVKLDFYSAIAQKQQSAGRHVAPLWYIILIPSQPVFALSP
jgi:hypothetical protein